MPEHTVQRDHPVQRAYLKRWCPRRNHVYFLDLRNEQAGWGLRHLEDGAFVVPDGDKLSDGEVEQLNRAAEKLRTETPLDQFADQMEVRRLRELPDKPIDRNSLETDLLSPIEQLGYQALREAETNPGGIRDRENFPWLARWVLLHLNRTKEGKKNLSRTIHLQKSNGRWLGLKSPDLWTRKDISSADLREYQ